MSTSSLEHIAEDLIGHILQKHEILVVKPKFDHNGADLLALLDVSDGAKFCRIQCKGRALLEGKKQETNIQIPIDYVTDAFIVILYVEEGQSIEITQKNLFCFFGADIRGWNITPENKYSLPFSKLNYRAKLSKYQFTNETANKIVKSIINVNIKGEFKTMIHGYAELGGFSSTINASGQSYDIK